MFAKRKLEHTQRQVNTKALKDAEKEQPASEWPRRKATEEASPAATGILNLKEPQDDQQTNFRCRNDLICYSSWQHQVRFDTAFCVWKVGKKEQKKPKIQKVKEKCRLKKKKKKQEEPWKPLRHTKERRF